MQGEGLGWGFENSGRFSAGFQMRLTDLLRLVWDNIRPLSPQGRGLGVRGDSAAGPKRETMVPPTMAALPCA